MRGYHEPAAVVCCPRREGYRMMAVRRWRTVDLVVATRVGGFVDAIEDGVWASLSSRATLRRCGSRSSVSCAMTAYAPALELTRATLLKNGSEHRRRRMLCSPRTRSP